MPNQIIANISERFKKEDSFQVSYEEGCELAALPREAIPSLLALAEEIRIRYKDNKIFTCSIINAKSGKCTEDCAYCSQSSYHKTDVEIYPLKNEEEIVTDAVRMREAGASRYSMVTSGYMVTDKDMDTICAAAERIRKETGMEVCSSLGILTKEMAKQLVDSGVTNYHHNLETARSHFHEICTTHKYEEDIETVILAKDAGMNVCCGGIMGLGENWEQRVELACTIRELDVTSIPLNFLNPIPGTRLENQPLVKPMDALKSIALFRMINPEKNITICGGREVTLRDFQSWIFMAGANGVMVGNYLTTSGRDTQADMEMIRELNMKITNDL